MKRSDFKKEEELKGMKVGDIRKHIEAFNRHYAIEGYSKLKKAALISAVLLAQTRLGGAKKTKKKVKLVIVEEPKKASPVAKKASPVAKKLTEAQRKSLLEDIQNEAEEYRYLDYVEDPKRYTFSDMSKAHIRRDTKKAKTLLKLVSAFFKTKKTPKFNAYFKKLIKDGKADRWWDGEDVQRESDAMAREVEGVVVQFGDEEGDSIKYFIGLAEKYEASH